MPHFLSKLAFDHILFANICSKSKAQLQCNIICEISWQKTFQKTTNKSTRSTTYDCLLTCTCGMLYFAQLASTCWKIIKHFFHYKGICLSLYILTDNNYTQNDFSIVRPNIQFRIWLFSLLRLIVCVDTDIHEKKLKSKQKHQASMLYPAM